MRAAGYTAVGEFHYLGFARGAGGGGGGSARPGSRSCSSWPRTRAAGCERFRQGSVAEYLGQVETLRADGVCVGVAPHSVRACPADWLEEIGRYAAAEGLPLHVHADEQPREIEECLAEHGLRPIELLARTGCLGPRTTVVHATHADAQPSSTCWPTPAPGSASARRPRRTSATATRRSSACSTRGMGICIGSDSNVRIDPLEELRELEGIARRRAGRRNVCSVGPLLCFGADEGARALGLESWPEVAVDLAHPSLRGVDRRRRARRARLRLRRRGLRALEVSAGHASAKRARANASDQKAVRSRYAVSAAGPCSP